MSRPKSAQVVFNEFGMPVATEFDDIYFSNDNGLAESRYVFLAQNDLPARWHQHSRSRFVVAETGFGTGLNVLALMQSFLTHAPSHLHLHIVSFEKYPLQVADMQRAHAQFPELAAYATELQEHYPAPEPGCHRRLLAGGRVTLDLWFGDLLDTLPQWLPTAKHVVDAWFLDGFAPDKNPQMWQPELYHAMASASAPASTFATFTAAGAVRRGLQAAGYTVSKAAGYGRKREMLRGVIAEHTPAVIPDTGNLRRIAIVGGGIAAAAAAQSCRARGWEVHIVSAGIADGASGNPQAAVYPLLHAQRSPLAEYFVAAFGYAQNFYRQHAADYWHSCGVLQLNYTAERTLRAQKIVQEYSSEQVQLWSPQHVQNHWSELPAQSALWYPTGGWLEAANAVNALLTDSNHTQATVARIEPSVTGWHLYDQQSQLILAADAVILAAGAGLPELTADWQLQFQNVRGQVTMVSSTATTATCPSVICYKGYFTPALQSQHCVGATYARQFSATEASQSLPSDTDQNLATLSDNLAPQAWPKTLTAVADRTSLRNTSRDHLPVVGELAAKLAVIGALGSRGFTAAPLAAEIIAAQWAGEPQPINELLRQRLLPQRLQVDRAVPESAPDPQA
ncbi:bifunctional tRNA (5-methylaminomethyl-2-thiouridine)(34)-methyltransferase MnmD/FAD-dependent 5-carboxymethylaminomethyl-2-thiouridine(34) oxidoreductase MnmC [Pseudidiomarina aestuarii]|uniref:tRNA 5-methylaminomethyl-2-thiouridine biosynthesis bifunctional protein MnmC n=1 Tax=Pseudidiomarina aestuarii TaxID=624146 RepID=A0A7Z6ZUI4_9GAMM|nr:bifunctional tRNA (5-methylaminomethyl-2-thiouridine)(34)-methyltransferase MnmD/FAD-dependent 5-carboxymethylaminomethyl-2-thiouridine(34) oxidoreductase MnmC [Pseudidiomarina aestuarii]RUO41476.1 bifunctional tRNA (5-methylaminomethyl-2-thiouridine)(34)-methyltransferase MnmD/FAD-dependent 5-carboxymethylaminomethyl-2-thiouridine(34) oxidoreductase MnmC [Pseudidiomarina aestuarii]